MRRNLPVIGLIAAVVVGLAPPSGALEKTPLLRTVQAAVPAGGTPSWASAAMQYVTGQDFISGRVLDANQPLSRKAFTGLMRRAFGGGYSKSRGKVTAREVDAALVKALGKRSVAAGVARTKSPNGFDPGVSLWDGFEIVAREMGLRHDRPTSEEAFESSANEPMLGADIAYAVWRAKTSPNTWGADEVATWDLDNIKGVRQKVVKYAFNQVGQPYVWGGEWTSRTPPGYPYGAQPHGGLDCSGFSWYVLRAAASGWHPKKRSYRGWALGDRSSSYMAANTPRRIGYKDLKTGDLMFFSSSGTKAASSVYHAGIYLGKGWMIDSAGGQAGVSLSKVGGDSWWRDQFVWGRRVIH
ncbi:MAG: NlpC/P60 family protein [Actinomycetota bacterium]|nr:NlpC/P60 family protein [Actinomycetota bacterium]